ncbi:hypothetical protein SAMD00023353_2700410 [Rosellinia necatrix]|uniref:Uncharacterized protein n=1 Tax=Rosellinia necatrix TaxID=77044 RepID=A0A1W2TGX3_ROSNE|nr:hypothetical protein SAMD00023353_2700410 [Rosellinia necatrix]
MSLTQQTGTEASHKVAALRGLLENPSIKPRIAPLVTLLMARDVDIHGKMLADLGSRVEQMKGSLDEESEHASRVSQRLHDIQQDANALRQIIQQDGRGDPDIGVDPEKLKFALTEAIKQNSTEVTRIGQRIMAVEKLIERQQQSSNGIKGILDTVGQGMESLQRDLNDLKHGFKEIPSTAPILQDMSILEGRVERCLDQSSKDAEDIKLSLAAITTQPGYDENLARGCLSDSPVLQPAKSANGNRTIDLIKTGSQGKP